MTMLALRSLSIGRAALLTLCLLLASGPLTLTRAQDNPTIILPDGTAFDPTDENLQQHGLSTKPLPSRREERKKKHSTGDKEQETRSKEQGASAADSATIVTHADSLALAADEMLPDTAATDSLSRHQLRKAQRREERILACIPLVDVTVDSQAIHKNTILDYYTSQPIGMLGHSPHTATMYAAVLPGLGQIYNHSYWKLAILYGGAGALAYAIHFNNKYYKKYSSAYRDFLLRDPNNHSYMEFANMAHLTQEQVETTYASWFQRTLKSKKDYYRRYRDMSIFGMVGLYLLQIVDACVDAHFWNFDVSDDLSIHVAPVATPENGGEVGATVGIDIGKGDKRHKRRKQ